MAGKKGREEGLDGVGRLVTSDLSVCSAGHVDPIDLNDLVPRLQSPVAGHQTVREDLLDHDAPQGGVGAAHDGDPQAGAGAGNLHVRNLPLQYGESRDACNDRD